MSELDHHSWEKGDTYGDSHTWQCNHVVKNPTTHERSTHWHCTACGVAFDHEYHVTKLIRQAMRQCGIPDNCYKS